MSRKIVFLTSIVLLAALILVFGVGSFLASLHVAGIEKTSGGCIYDTFPGNCMIVSVRKTLMSRGQKRRTGYDGWEVKVNYKESVRLPTEKEKFLRSFSKKDRIMLRLVNFWLPGAKFIRKYLIIEGETFPCTLKLINQGKCTPMLLQLNGVPLDDFCDLPPKGIEKKSER